MLKKIAGMLVCGCLVCNVGIVSAEETEGFLEDIPIEISTDLAVYAKYMWRGFKLDDDPVLQPGLYLSAYRFTASIWGSFDIDAEDALNSDEVDYAIDYTYSFDMLSLSAGHTYYDFPAADAKSTEFYIGVALDTLLSPSLTWYHDYADEDSGGGDGDYILLGIGHSFTLGNGPITLDLGASAGYNSELFIDGDGGDVGLSAGLTFPLTKNCTFVPSVNYSIPFGDLKDSDDGNQDDEVFIGAILTFN
ncbi:MAG: hypothetical protein JW844_03795 [Candidatus Omnitrophica bacterium]|nr:hypothetical protein [Candidatus Omnitrophota bacterium]